MIYFVRLGPEGPIKIGTTTCFRRRLKQLAAEYGVEVRILGVRDGGPIEERGHHARFAHLRLREGLPGPCERFRPEFDLLDYIERECREPDLFDGPNENGPTVIMQLKLPTRAHKLLRRVAAADDISMASYARDLVATHIEDEAKRRGIKL